MGICPTTWSETCGKNSNSDDAVTPPTNPSSRTATTGNGGNSASNGPNNGEKVALQRKVKQPGGCTGKGFKPGQSGNPLGAQLGRRKEAFAFGNYLRDWLAEEGLIKGPEGEPLRKEVRLKTLVENLAANKPEVLLNYAFGKPVEIHEVAAAEGTELEFVVRVHGGKAGE